METVYYCSGCIDCCVMVLEVRRRLGYYNFLPEIQHFFADAAADADVKLRGATEFVAGGVDPHRCKYQAAEAIAVGGIQQAQ